LNLKNQEEMKENEGLLPSEKEESQTLVRTLISLQMHTISQAISHSTTGTPRVQERGEKLKIYCKTMQS
jgi:hypothetical protein